MKKRKIVQIPSRQFIKVVPFILFIFVSSFLIPVRVMCAEKSQPQQVQVTRKTILDYKAEVGLSDKQVKEIEKLIGEFEKRLADRAEKIREKDTKLKELLSKEGDIKEIGRYVREIYRLRGDNVVDDLETGRNIESLLTREQKDKWREIKRGNIQGEQEKQGGNK